MLRIPARGRRVARRLITLRDLPRLERRTVVVAVPSLVITRLLLSGIPVSSVKHPVRWLARIVPIAFDDDAQALGTIPRAVTTASRYVPGGRHCLTKALVAAALLEAAGVPVAVRAGVRRRADGSLTGHAWLERDGRVVMQAGEDPTGFVPLSRFQEVVDGRR